MDLSLHSEAIQSAVQFSIHEDVKTGDITAQLIPESQMGHAKVISRERAVIAGSAWVNEVFKQVDPSVEVIWRVSDGQWVEADQTLFELKGKSRSLLTGERCALNFLQTLSGTATICRHYASLVEGTGVRLDTRKTLPGLRIAQKYAVSVGGCFNHRIGLFDAFLIKENHIMAAGSISQAIAQAHQIAPGKPVEVEVENTEQLQEAVKANADIIMLDNFTPDQTRQAVSYVQQETQGSIKLEASGGINQETLRPYAETGVDFISIGALTKDCQSIDLSMRFL